MTFAPQGEAIGKSIDSYENINTWNIHAAEFVGTNKFVVTYLVSNFLR